MVLTAKWGKCDFRQLKDFQKRIDRLNKVDKDIFCEEAVKELAARLLRKVIKRTPVGQYPASSGKNGGTLRRGWSTIKASDLIVKRIGNVFEIEIINPVEYASYVEYGHRTANHKGWVPGKFFLTKSEIELEAQAPGFIEKKLIKYLGEVFNGE